MILVAIAAMTSPLLDIHTYTRNIEIPYVEQLNTYDIFSRISILYKFEEVMK
jgi:hypothetical protein